MKMLSHNSLVAVVLDKVDAVSPGGIELVRKSNAWAMHQGKKRIATVVAAPEKFTIYKNRVDRPDKPITTPCPVVANDRVYLTRLAGAQKFEYLGKQILLVRVGEIHGILDDCPPQEDLTDYIAKITEHKEFPPEGMRLETIQDEDAV